ncbi:hypothetical protein ACI797_04090 [Geodermatophilus sp. SYSU D00691]
MATGRMRRSAGRGLGALVLAWLAAVVAAVVLAPGASAAPSATIQIRTLTPPVASVDAGGTVTFVNQVASYDTGVTLPLVGGATATVHTDVAVTFFGEKRTLQYGQQTSWTFPSTTAGTVTYTYRIVPQGSLAANLVNQVVDAVAAVLPPLPAPIPYVVQTLVPLPDLPSTNLPDPPEVAVAVPGVPSTLPPPGGAPTPLPGAPVPTTTTTTTTTTTGGTAQSVPGTQYTYDTGAGAPQMAPVDSAAAAAFDPSRFTARGGGSSGGATGGSGASGIAGTYDGASVPVFGQLAGLDGDGLEEADSQVAAPGSGSAANLPVPALAAVVALAAVTAALVRTQQAARAVKGAHRRR